MVYNIGGVRALEHGAVGTTIYGSEVSGGNWPGKRVRDVSDEIHLLDAQNSALTTLVRAIRKKKGTDIKFEWIEDTFPVGYTVTAAGDTSSADTTIGVGTGEGVLGRLGDLWMVSSSGEIVYVISVSTDTWTVIRGIGDDSDAEAIDSGDTLYYIGNAISSGTIARTKLSTQVTMPYNYNQIFEEGVEIAKDADMTKMYGGSDRLYQRRKAGIKHLRDRELSFWFGKRDLKRATDNAGIAHAAGITGGVFYWIQSANEISDTGSLSFSDFELYCEDIFRYGSKMKTMFCSPRACSVIDGWGISDLRTLPTDQTYGIVISRLRTSHGELNIIRNDVFYDFNATSLGTAYNTCSVVLQLEDLVYHYMRDTELQMNIQGNDEDTFEDQYLTQCGLELANPEHHWEIHGWAV